MNEMINPVEEVKYYVVKRMDARGQVGHGRHILFTFNKRF